MKLLSRAIWTIAFIVSVTVFTGCSSGDSSSGGSTTPITENPTPTPGTLSVSVVSGYITDINVTDSNATEAALQNDGSYLFEDGSALVFPLQATGTADDGSQLTLTLHSYALSGGVISPVTTLIADNSALQTLFSTSLSAALTDYKAQNHVDATRLSELAFELMTGSHPEAFAEFQSRLSGVTGFADIPKIMPYIIRKVDAVGLRVLLLDLKNYSGTTVAELETLLNERTALIDYRYDLEGNRTKLDDLITAYDGNLSADPESAQTLELEKNLIYADTSGLDNFDNLFVNKYSFNVPIGAWDVSNVTSMVWTFGNAGTFNQDITAWDTGSLSILANTFYLAASFNQDLSYWNTDNVTVLYSTFSGASSFNQPIGDWNTSGVTNMLGMFEGATLFNQDIGGWDVSNVTTMTRMFNNAPAFNQDISNWNVGSVTDFSTMFKNALSFNQDLSSWDTSSATVMSDFASGATAWEVAHHMVFTTNDIFVVGDYLESVTSVVDNSGHTATSLGDGAFGFLEPIAAPVTVTGTTADGETFVMSSYSDLISPLTTLVGNNAALQSAIQANISADALGDYIANDDFDAAYLAEVAYGVLRGSDTTAKTHLESILTSGATVADIKADMNALIKTIDPVGARVFLLELKNFAGTTVAALQSDLADEKALIAYSYNLSGSKSALVALIDDYESNFLTDPTASATLEAAKNLIYADTSGITDFAELFKFRATFNLPIGAWDTSAVTTFLRTFYSAERFNQDITAWDTGSATDMLAMFAYASDFNQPIGEWNTANVTTMAAAFAFATSFNQDLSAWDVSGITTVSGMVDFANGATAWEDLNQIDFITTDITVIAGYLSTVTSVSDFNGLSGSLFDGTTYRFMGNAVAPFTVSGTTEDGEAFEMSSYSSLVSPITTLVGNDTNLVNAIQTNISADALGDYVTNEDFDAAYLAEIAYGVLRSSDTTAKTELQNLLIAGASTPDFPNDMNALIKRSEPVGVRVLLLALKHFEGATVADLQNDLAVPKRLINYRVDVGNNIYNLVNLVTAYDNNYTADPTSTMTRALEQNLTYADTSSMPYLSSLFSNLANFNVNIGAWDTSNVINMQMAFLGARSFNQDISAWNTAKVTSLYRTFEEADSFDQELGEWNTSSVTNMNKTFYYTDTFNQDINGWDTSNVTTMGSMFCGAVNFNQPLGNWNTTKVTDMSTMFGYALRFNQALANWDTSNVTLMYSMFELAPLFNQDISDWNTSSVTNMRRMFSGATRFNQDIGGWDISSVTDNEGLASMFKGCTDFNQYIGDWNTSSIVKMDSMFEGAMNFNQDIGGWDTSKVRTVNYMFRDAISFNQDLTDWNVSSVLSPMSRIGFDTNTSAAWTLKPALP